MSEQKKPTLGVYRELASPTPPEPPVPVRERWRVPVVAMLLLCAAGIGGAAYAGHRAERARLHAATRARVCLFGEDVSPPDPAPALRAHQLRQSADATLAPRLNEGIGWPRTCASDLRVAATAKKVERLEDGKVALLALANVLAVSSPFDSYDDVLRIALRDLDVLAAPTVLASPRTPATLLDIEHLPASAQLSPRATSMVQIDGTPRVHSLLSPRKGEYQLCTYDDATRSAACEPLVRQTSRDYASAAASDLDLPVRALNEPHGVTSVLVVEQGVPQRLWFRRGEFTPESRYEVNEIRGPSLYDGPPALMVTRGGKTEREELRAGWFETGRVLWDQLLIASLHEPSAAEEAAELCMGSLVGGLCAKPNASDSPSRPLRLLARPVDQRRGYTEIGSVNPLPREVVFGFRPPYESRRIGDPEAPDLDACESGAVQLLRLSGADGMLWQRDATTGALRVRNQGALRGRFTCHEDIASFVEVDLEHERIVRRRCVPDHPCAESVVPLSDLDHGVSELRPAERWEVQALDLHGTLVVVWRTARAGVRMRIATPEQLGTTDDVLLLDDPRGLLRRFDLQAGADSAVLTLEMDEGTYAFRIDPSGALEPWRTIQR